MHDASRTGAPMVLLYFLQWFKKKHPNIVVSVLAIKDGELEEEFRKVSFNYYSLNKIKNKPTAYLQKKILSKLGKYKSSAERKEEYLKAIAQEDFDIIYSNTIISIPFGDQIKSFNKNSKHIVHIHELNAIIKLKLPDLDSYASTIDHFVAASNLVKENLISNWAISKQKVTRVYECSEVTSKIEKNKQQDVFTIGGSGTVHWRKGSDLFIQVASIVKKLAPDIQVKFIWVGSISKVEQIIIEEDLSKMGVKNIVSFVGQKYNPSKYFNEFDLFLMTSREDPFPLVCIEVGMLGKPIICFKGATGSEEIIEKGGGAVVPYLDINEMAEKIIEYKNNPELLKSHGEISKNEFSKFTTEIICPEIYAVINKI